MAATLSELMSIARNSDFQTKIKYACQKAALTVMAEDPTVNRHFERVAFARAILGVTPPGLQTVNYDVGEYAIGYMTVPTIAAQASILNTNFGLTDTDFDSVVASLFNAFAGISN
jgi:hypothetical protein